MQEPAAHALKNVQQPRLAADVGNESMSTVTLSLFALSLLFRAPGIAAPARAEPGPTQSSPSGAAALAGQPLTLAIAGPQDDAELAERLRPAVADMLRTRGHEVDPGAVNGVFVVVDIDPDAPDTYRIEVRLELDGGTQFNNPSHCTRCDSNALVEHVGFGLDGALPGLPPADLAPAEDVGRAPGEVRGGTAEPNLDAPDEARRDDTKLRLRTRGVVGAGLLGLGVAAVASGATMWVVRATPHPKRADWELQLRTPAAVMMAAGGAGAVAGAVLLGLDLARRGRARTSATPMVGRGVAGLTLRGHF